MEPLLIAITCWLLLQLAFTIWNLSRMPRLGQPVQRQSWERQYDRLTSSRPSRPNSDKLLLSVLIPVRDEERNIRECLESISACQTETMELEILVMNDHSEDETEAEIRHMMAQDDRIQLFHSGVLPEGWLGKSYACHQLSLHARGEWWLFVDADVRLQPDALEAALVTARAQRTGLISGFPRMETGTWLEHIVVPMMAFIIGYHLPIMMIRRSPRPIFLAVTGAWLMVHRDSYTRSGGHAHIYNHIVEDMELARAVKQAGDPVTLADVHRHTSARMYRNAAEVWEGYKKNIFAGTGRSPLLVFGVTLFYALLFVFPLVMLIWSVSTAQLTLAGWAGAAVLIGMVTKGIIDRFGGKSCWLGLLMPISASCLILILLDSWIASLNGKGYRWKGRTYG